MFRTVHIDLSLGFSSGCLQRKPAQEFSAWWETLGIHLWERFTLHGSPLELISDGSCVPSCPYEWYFHHWSPSWEI